MNRLTVRSAAEKKVLLYSALAALAVLLGDQASKWYFILNFKLNESRELIPGLLSFTSVRNPGAAWSMFSGYSWVLMLFGVIVALLLCCFFRKITEGWVERYFALAVAIAGIIGNTIDRICFGVVVDFIHVHYYDIWHYPVFNVADMAICCGVGVIMLSNFCRPEKKVAAGEEK